MMLIQKDLVQIFQAAGNENKLNNFFDVVVLLNHSQSVKLNKSILLKVTLERSSTFQQTNFSSHFQAIFLHISGSGIASLRTLDFKTNPFSSEAQQSKQSPVLGSHRVSIHKRPGPGSQGCLGRKSVTLMFRPQVHILYGVGAPLQHSAQCYLYLIINGQNYHYLKLLFQCLDLPFK